MKLQRLILTFFLILLAACNARYEISTWNEWCDHECGEGVAEKGQGIITSYNYQRIREDFIQDQNEILVEEIVGHHLWDSTLHANQEVEALIKARKLGFWRENNSLHFADIHLNQQILAGDVQRFKAFLQFENLKNNKYQLNNFQLCTYRAIDDFFDKFVIHTPEGSETIQLDFSFKTFFAEK